MSAHEVQRWLAELQARFGAALRTPLEASGGTLHADLSQFSEQVCADLRPSAKLSAAERLSIYQRQYWMRLLRVLQEQYPLTTQLLGAWFFNQYAVRFLLAHAPRTHDLGDVAHGFDAFLAGDLRHDPVQHEPGGPSLPRAALLEAACLDAAFRRVFMAAEQPAFRVTSEDEAALPRRRLQLSTSFTRFEEHWPLLQLRSEIFAQPQEHAVALPSALPASQTWALYRSERGVVHRRLDREHARMLALLEEHDVGQTLSILESECAGAAREALPTRVRSFFALSMQLGFFSGWRDA